MEKFLLAHDYSRGELREMSKGRRRDIAKQILKEA